MKNIYKECILQYKIMLKHYARKAYQWRLD
jgi:hypothetical protein